MYTAQVRLSLDNRANQDANRSDAHWIWMNPFESANTVE